MFCAIIYDKDYIVKWLIRLAIIMIDINDFKN